MLTYLVFILAIAAIYALLAQSLVLVWGQTGMVNLGLVGFLLKQAPDVRTALNDLVRYLHHHDRGAVPAASGSGRDGPGHACELGVL